MRSSWTSVGCRPTGVGHDATLESGWFRAHPRTFPGFACLFRGFPGARRYTASNRPGCSSGGGRRTMRLCNP
jgi:hypothetical protein